MHIIRSSVMLSCVVSCLAASSSNVVHEHPERGRDSLKILEKLPGSFLLPMRIGLTQSNMDRGPDFLYEVYV